MYCSGGKLSTHPCFTPRHKPGPIEVALLDELRTTIHAELVPTTSSFGMTVLVTAFYGNLHIDHITAIRAMPYQHIGPPVVKVGAAVRAHLVSPLPSQRATSRKLRAAFGGPFRFQLHSLSRGKRF